MDAALDDPVITGSCKMTSNLVQLEPMQPFVPMAQATPEKGPDRAVLISSPARDPRPMADIKPTLQGSEDVAMHDAVKQDATMDVEDNPCSGLGIQPLEGQLEFMRIEKTNATEEQWKGIKRILRYINGTVEWGIWFKSNDCNSILVFADSDYANLQNRKLILGFILDVYGNMGPVGHEEADL
ncbi:hypothetical protein FOCC_FOCC007337 [Frankliniella occidentalis]|nr:hypothetical protein FOCC_FOCC007337 [Frankliniella occidentalis]